MEKSQNTLYCYIAIESIYTRAKSHFTSINLKLLNEKMIEKKLIYIEI